MLKNLYKICLGLMVLSLFLANNSWAAELVPNDTFFSRQTYLQKLNFSSVWGQQTGGSQTVIAVIDSGVDINHPDLKANIWQNQREIIDGIDNDNNGYVDDLYGWDFITGTTDPSPKYSQNCLQNQTCVEEAILHGTFVAGVAAAVGNNNLGITGVSWHTKIMALRVLNEAGSGITEDVIKAINYAVDNGADIINLSFVGDTYDVELEAAIQRAYEKGKVIVVAAGNEDIAGHRVNLDNVKMYPVCHRGKNGEEIVIGVASVDENNHLSTFSNYGSDCIAVVAPGENFWGLLVQNKMIASLKNYYGGDFSGTSLAAPIVSGLAALMKSYRPSLGNWEIKAYIEDNAENIDAFNPQFVGELGKGLINPLRVFQALNPNFLEAHLIKSPSSNVVYYKALDGQRYVFPNEATYFSWFSDFSNIQIVSDAELASLMLGGNVTVRPGIKMIKISSLSNVYAVDQGGVLRWIQTEDLAAQIYGSNWNQQIVDISDAFFVNYKIGAPIAVASDFIPQLISNNVTSIDKDKGF